MSLVKSDGSKASGVVMLSQMQLNRMVNPNDPAVLMPPPTALPNYLTPHTQSDTEVDLNHDRRVLEEEEYLKSIENIIERDFFPTLHILHSQEKLEDSVSEAGLDDDTDNRVKDKMKLNQFFANYVSEDNNSFEKILEKDKKKRMKDYHWAYDSLPSSNGLLIEDDASRKKKENLMLYYMNNAELTVKQREEFDKLLDGEVNVGDDRPAVPKTWPLQIRNPLMFPPQSPKPTDLIVSNNQSSSASSTRRKTTLQGQKEVVYANTNFEKNSLLSLLDSRRADYPSPSSSVYENSTWETDSVFQMSEHGNSKRHKRDYSIVPMTPQIIPGVDMSPLITWGEAGKAIPLTPARNNEPNNGSTDSNSDPVMDGFLIKDIRQREKLGRQLDSYGKLKQSTSNIQTPMSSVVGTPLSIYSDSARSIASQSRSVAGSTISKSSSMSTSKRLKSLTPAGYALAHKIAQSKGSTGNVTPFGGGLK